MVFTKDYFFSALLGGVVGGIDPHNTDFEDFRGQAERADKSGS